jgi:IS30 family transposase
MHFHLTQNQRIELSLLLRLGYSQRQIALMFGVSPSTICRELRRNRRVSGMYNPNSARVSNRSRRAAANTLRTKLLACPKLAATVEQRLVRNDSPEQIAGWLRSSGAKLRVATQTIYDWLYRYARHLLERLHCRKGKYRHTRENSLRKALRDKQKEGRRITARPSHALERKTYGHWEGDTVVGKGRSGCIATFVERKNKLKIYFAQPYHSWERGTNENTNGLLRFYPETDELRSSHSGTA